MNFYVIESKYHSRGNKIRYVVDEDDNVNEDANGMGFKSIEKTMNHFMRYCYNKKKFKQKC